MKTGLALFFVYLAVASAQNALDVGRPVKGDLAAGGAHSYTIQLHAGDYVAGSITQDAPTGMAVFQPDGSRLRRFPGPPDAGNRQFAFVAGNAGTWRLDFNAPADRASKYEVKVSELIDVDQRMKPLAKKDRYASPRIEALRQDIARSQNSTASFWERVSREGTPLVEPAANDDAHQLVTFLWRGTPETRNVYVLASVHSPQYLDFLMNQLPGSDVWYVTVKLPRGARFIYSLSPNDPLTDPGSLEDQERAAQRLATVQADPLNPHRVFCPVGASLFACQSVAELPGAVPQPWIVKKAETPAGKIEQHNFKSERLKNERTISVYTPPGYRADGKPYALAVIFDREAYLDPIPAPVILDNLIAASKIPATVAILISNPGQDARNRELAPNSDFAEFLAKELIPWAHEHYNVTADPRLTVVAGSSFGGIAATYAGLRHPEVFGNVLCQSGSFWWAPDRQTQGDPAIETGWLAKEFIKSPKLPLKFYMDAGVFETDMGASGGAILEPSRHMRDVLLAKGYPVTYQQFVGGHDFMSWRGTFADGLMALIGTEAAGSSPEPSRQTGPSQR